ncbi:MAG: GIY-YIG nuclease family protein [Richelia sp. SM1_7_0]|nr:GIY-YIG nuclease family protein [Richelia sp. SM1_7_0]
MLRSAAISRHLSHLPQSEATYILSQYGFIKYVGCTNNLQRRMSHHKSQNKKIHFDSGSLLHWFSIRDPDLERELQRRLRPTLGTISIYQSLDSIPYIFRDFYLRKINYLIDSIPDDCQEASLVFNQIFGYYLILQKHSSRTYLEECLQWRIKCDAMRSLARRQRLREKAIA